jgi:hypothetical protein
MDALWQYYKITDDMAAKGAWTPLAKSPDGRYWIPEDIIKNGNVASRNVTNIAATKWGAQVFPMLQKLRIISPNANNPAFTDPRNGVPWNADTLRELYFYVLQSELAKRGKETEREQEGLWTKNNQYRQGSGVDDETKNVQMKRGIANAAYSGVKKFGDKALEKATQGRVQSLPGTTFGRH